MKTFTEILLELRDEEKLNLINNYTEAIGDYAFFIHYFDDLEDLMDGYTTMEVFEAGQLADLSYRSKYITRRNGYFETIELDDEIRTLSEEIRQYLERNDLQIKDLLK